MECAIVLATPSGFDFERLRAVRPLRQHSLHLYQKSSQCHYFRLQQSRALWRPTDGVLSVALPFVVAPQLSRGAISMEQSTPSNNHAGQVAG